jgi:hypothetical protein
VFAVCLAIVTGIEVGLVPTLRSTHSSLAIVLLVGSG